MSRTNPRKRKPRQAWETARIVVEGYTEDAFCSYLKSLFAKDCGVQASIQNVKGGSPLDVVRTALKPREYNRTFIVYDTDVALPKTWAAKAKNAKLIAIPSSPCIEALFLELLKKPVPPDTQGCKKAFAKVLDDKAKCLWKSYAKIFPKELLVSCKISSQDKSCN